MGVLVLAQKIEYIPIPPQKIINKALKKRGTADLIYCRNCNAVAFDKRLEYLRTYYNEGTIGNICPRCFPREGELLWVYGNFSPKKPYKAFPVLMTNKLLMVLKCGGKL